MINQYPLWKNLLILAVLLLSIIYALPNLYGEDPALQITNARAGKLEAGVQDRVESALKRPVSTSRASRRMTRKYWCVSTPPRNS